ncbi:MAG: carboxypeptidase-like regulatory domain-containing protein [bacterium]|nr:carboxypeptidase-like regulatory domain-containing protein [bacterium]
MTHFKLTPAVALILVVAVIGCGGETKPVSGKVTLDGEPLKGATVAFIPVEGGRANSIATTAADGTYELSYTSTAKGAIPGKYLVQVMVLKQTDQGEVETLPSQYNVKSTLTAEVVAGGENYFPFDLESE